MSFRILHFATDDKFIPLVQDLYEQAFPGANRFKLLRKVKTPTNFVAVNANTETVETSYFRSEQVKSDLSNCDCLVIHAIRPNYVPAFDVLPESVLVVWCGWGFDYCELLESDCLEKHPLRSIAERVDVCSVLPADYAALQRVLSELNATLHLLPYYSTEDSFQPGPALMHGDDILVGNSGDPSNNHLSILPRLPQLHQVLVPLSYGGDASYLSEVLAAGETLFADRFVPLQEFLDLDGYTRALASCGTVVMNHRRQQALGTISLALYKGARVFLHPESPILPFYRDLGVVLYPSTSIEAVQSEPHREQNREILEKFWSRATGIARIAALRSLCRREHRD